MRDSLTILISSAGCRVQLIGCFRDAAAQLGLPLTVLATDANPSEYCSRKAPESFHAEQTIHSLVDLRELL